MNKIIKNKYSFNLNRRRKATNLKFFENLFDINKVIY